MERTILLVATILASANIWAQQGLKKNVLFVGNSYIGVNNLPQLTANVSLSAGDTIVFDSNTPGGYTFQGHSTDATTLTKISRGDWDYVVLQEQSQRPAFPISQVQVDVYPFARRLDSLINAQNSCAETVFYMTWGRKNGDAGNCPNYPPICTYAGMDDLLRDRYTTMANDNNAILSPVGAVWRYIRTNNPLVELYSADESHPSLAGSYAAACCFYTAIFRKSPLGVTTDAGVSAADAAIIRNAVDQVVYRQLPLWNIGDYDPVASFSHALNGHTAQFSNTSSRYAQSFWNFGDGSTSTATSPSHIYTSPGTYNVSLAVSRCGLDSTITMPLTIVSTNVGEAASSPLKANLVAGNLVISNLLPTEPFSIFNASGKLIYAGNPSVSLISLEISAWPAGIYWIKQGKRTVKIFR